MNALVGMQSAAWLLRRSRADSDRRRGITAERARAGQTVRKKARAGKLTGKTARAKEARAKLTDLAVKHARSQLRALGYRPPIDREALLAAYLDQQRDPQDRNPHPAHADAGRLYPPARAEGPGSTSTRRTGSEPHSITSVEAIQAAKKRPQPRKRPWPPKATRSACAS